MSAGVKTKRLIRAGTGSPASKRKNFCAHTYSRYATLRLCGGESYLHLTRIRVLTLSRDPAEENQSIISPPHSPQTLRLATCLLCLGTPFWGQGRRSTTKQKGTWGRQIIRGPVETCFLTRPCKDGTPLPKQVRHRANVLVMSTVQIFFIIGNLVCGSYEIQVLILERIRNGQVGKI